MKRRVTREEIIRTTRDLILRNGLQAVRVDEIAQTLEISKRTLYELFNDKDTLVEQCWAKIREEQEARIARFLVYKPGVSLEQTQSLINEFIANLWYINSSSLQELQRKKVYADIYEKGRKIWLDAFSQLLNNCITDGTLLPELDCQRFANRLMTILFHMYMDGSTRREMEALGWALLRGIATQEGINWLDNKRQKS